MLTDGQHPQRQNKMKSSSVFSIALCILQRAGMYALAHRPWNGFGKAAAADSRNQMKEDST